LLQPAMERRERFLQIERVTENANEMIQSSHTSSIRMNPGDH
jgi:hypothetical protein